MEHLWSPAGATSGNRWQMGHVRKPLKQADPQPVATHGNRFAAHGKEGVDGSSPSEGLQNPCSRGFCVCVQSVHSPLRAWMEPFMELSRRERALMRPDVPREWRAVAVSPRSL